MAKDIYIKYKMGDLSSRILMKAISELETAQSKLFGVDASMTNQYYFNPSSGYSELLYAPEITEKVNDLGIKISKLIERLEKYASIINSGPDELVEIDWSYKSELTDWWGRTAYHVSDFISDPLASLTGLFASSKKTSGDVSIVRDEYTGPYAEVVDDFDWRKTTATNSQIEAAVNEGMRESLELGSDVIASIRRKLRTLYENTRMVDKSTEIIVTPYSQGVTKGSFRYVDQTPGYQGSNGWGNRAGDSGGECCTACESMALSYMGIDVSPAQLLSTGKSFQENDGEKVKVRDGTLDDKIEGLADISMTSYWEKWDDARIDSMVSEFEQDGNAGNTSPVLIRYRCPNSDGDQNSEGAHWIMLVGKNDDGTYQAIGPWGEGHMWENKATVKIEDGRITCMSKNLSKLQMGEVGICHAFVQYSRD